MVTTVWALDAVSGAPSYTGEMLRNVDAVFAGVAPVGYPLGVRSGVRPGTPASTAYLSGANDFTWNVGPHAGIVQAESAALAGGYRYWTDGTDSGPITAANATYPRVDCLYVQINDSVQDASGLASGVVGYAAGVAAASPVAPTVPARSMLLATISVPPAGSGNPAISWAAPTFGEVPRAQMALANGVDFDNNIWLRVPFTTVQVDSDAMTSSANDYQYLTVNTPGSYLVTAQFTLSGGTVVAETWATPSSGCPSTLLASVEIPDLAAGTQLSIQALQSSGATLTNTSNASNIYASFLRAQWVG